MTSPIRTKFQEQLKAFMQARDEVGVATLRLIMAALKDRDIAARSKNNWDGIGDDEVLSMLQSMVKQRQESIKMYEAGKRPDLVARETAEIKVIETFLPRQMSEDEVRAAIESAIQSTGAAGIRDMGKVMAGLKAGYAGQMDFTRASALLKERLSA